MIVRWLVRRYTSKRLAEERERAKNAVNHLCDLKDDLEYDLRLHGERYLTDLKVKEAEFKRVLQDDMDCYNEVLPLLQEMVHLMPTYFQKDLEVAYAEIQVYEIQAAIGAVKRWIAMIGIDLKQLKEIMNHYLHLQDRTREITEIVSFQNPGWPLTEAPNPVVAVDERRVSCDSNEGELRKSLWKLKSYLQGQNFRDELLRIDSIMKEKCSIRRDHEQEKQDLFNLKRTVEDTLEAAKAEQKKIGQQLRDLKSRIVATWQQPPRSVKDLNAELDEMYRELKSYQPIHEELKLLKSQIDRCHREACFSDLSRLKERKNLLQQELEPYWKLRDRKNDVCKREKILRQAWQWRRKIVEEALNAFIRFRPLPESHVGGDLRESGAN